MQDREKEKRDGKGCRKVLVCEEPFAARLARGPGNRLGVHFA